MAGPEITAALFPRNSIQMGFLGKFGGK